MQEIKKKLSLIKSRQDVNKLFKQVDKSIMKCEIIFSSTRLSLTLKALMAASVNV